ncbi:MAG: glutamyl-tRNA reductase [Planctomycetes bacterium]|nr:glutamyl-tRNA reductase [Planctomycetota bacterium]
MDPRRAVVLVGISHRTAPVALRERYVVSASDLPRALASLRALEGVDECFVLSTCNRTEALLVGARGRDLAGAARAQLFRNLEPSTTYSFEGMPAVIHAFRVAGGLDSLVLGESEVLAQWKRGFEAAAAAGTLGPVLRPLLQQALHAGKRVRTETSLGQGSLSVARIGVDLAERVFGTFEDESALVIGAGETGLLVAQHLAGRGIGGLTLANRTLERAIEAARALNARACSLDVLPAEIGRADLIVACVEAGAPPLDARHFDRRTLRRRDKPLLVLDLSVPRAVAAEVAALDPNVLVYDLDDLQRIVQENQKGRHEAAEGTSAILVAEIHKYLTTRTYSAFTPVIADLRRRFEEIREATLDAHSGARSDPREVQLAHELTKRLLDVALEQMKAGARSVSSEEELAIEYRRFLENL